MGNIQQPRNSTCSDFFEVQLFFDEYIFFYTTKGWLIFEALCEAFIPFENFMNSYNFFISHTGAKTPNLYSKLWKVTFFEFITPNLHSRSCSFRYISASFSFSLTRKFIFALINRNRPLFTYRKGY